MKITGEAYSTIERACLDTLKAHSLHPFMVQTNRHAWDVFNKAADEGRLDVAALYRSYNDAHIQTALHRIFKTARGEGV